MNEFFTVDQFAQVLHMHPRTVRRYIREGQLRATKVGREWRIRKEDADMFMGGNAKELHDNAIDDVQSYIDGFNGQVTGKLQVCAVLDCHVDDKEEAFEIAKIVMRHMNEDHDYGPAKSQYFYDKDTKKGRYILWGNPTFIGRILSSVGEFTNQS
ncbi:helix-turn-helix domain-containing protein [Alicyclobacillus sp. SO9]|uniref:helix-turn-helix domain-containing protein n=1 Tax=Alicyclobacillus sp. SO9 TaxID=2665646 RepID=UPI0018E7C466|nr:helix-turn-helix domain-containing protein [Alicyclobacillus sp. SO9]QQE77212.1 helix-turn-helix domain-containing protein [Alicyclobacillus sp. SO9]